MPDKEFGPYYWNKPNETFAGKGLGADITEHLKTWDEKAIEKYLKQGWISTKKAETVEIAKDTELQTLKKTVAELTEECEALKREIADAPKTLKEAKAEIKELKAKLKGGK